VAGPPCHCQLLLLLLLCETAAGVAYCLLLLDWCGTNPKHGWPRGCCWL